MHDDLEALYHPYVNFELVDETALAIARSSPSFESCFLQQSGTPSQMACRFVMVVL